MVPTQARRLESKEEAGSAPEVAASSEEAAEAEESEAATARRVWRCSSTDLHLAMQHA